MRAAVLAAYDQAPRCADRPAPTATPGRSLVRPTAVPLTPLDVLCASGTSYFGAPPLPYVPGVQGVGRVVASDHVPVGARVWFPTTAGMAPGDGSLAELISVADGDLVTLGEEVPDTAVAALGLSAMAAWTALLDRGGLQAGERVLVLGSSGVVGTVAVRAAVLNGASAVFAAAVEETTADDARLLGAHGFVPLGAARDVDELVGRIRDVVGEVDLVLDPLCGMPASAAALCLAPHGRLVNLGSSAGAEATFSSAHLRSGSRSILGYTNNDLDAERRTSAMAAILTHAAAGRLEVRHEVFALDDVQAAWEAHRRGDVRGRAVVAIS